MNKKIILACCIIGVLGFQNCKDDKDPEPTPITAPIVTLPTSIKNVDGILMAISTSTKASGIELIVGSAQAVFFKNKNPLIKVEAGTVKINMKTCTRSDDSLYFYTASATEPTGIVYKSQILWQTTGTADVPLINDNDGGGMPNMPTVPEFLNMSITQDKLINWVSSYGGDSTIFIIKGPLATYKRTFNNTISSHTVTLAEIAKLGKGAATLQIINYKLISKTLGTKSYAFLKQMIGNCTKVTITP